MVPGSFGGSQHTVVAEGAPLERIGNTMNESKCMNRIIVAVDEDGRSDHAVRAGLGLGRVLESSVEILHAVPVPPPLWPDVNPVQLASINAEALTEAWNTLSEHFKGVFAEHGHAGRPLEDLLRVMPGHPAQVVIDRAKELDAGLVVLGPHKKRRLLDFGSTARAILAKVPGNVWIQPCAARPIHTILAPTDLSDHSLAALEQTICLARALGAEVRTLFAFVSPELAYSYGMSYPVAGPTYVIDEARESTKKAFLEAMAKLEWGDVKHTDEFCEGDAVDQILEAQEGVDLIAMGTHGRTGLSRVVLGNVAYGVMRSADVPVLAMRHPEREWLT